MPENSALSVIIPVLNNPVGLKRCIEAIRKQRIGCELIVVDNGSTDQTLEIANSYADMVLQHPGLTVGAMRNRGAQVANGQVLVFIDSDQEPSEDWLACGIRAIGADDRIGMVGARYHTPQGSRWVARSWDLQRRYSDVPGEIGWLQGGNLFVNREAFERVGGFRSDLIASEDVDLSFRIRRSGYLVVCDPRVVNYHHGDPQTLVEFFLKERWRGSSGWRAWALHGYPLSDLPSLLWPFWVVFSLPALIVLSLGFGARYSSLPSSIWVLLAILVWVSPAWIRAAKTCLGVPQFFLNSVRLAFLYLTYGFSRFASLYYVLPTRKSRSSDG